ncbi:hypothetical protein PN36_12435 [Candidatus Thiomargarita nelsonii]|uniref:DUF945 domain-containing protein n=1 Tax=Candidatus Thiomargarita nelsonii TaxID=1003181 RepID=A0A4E0R471_9GAMM|nr:hypothetical protein PN36_12435 [Candidatus Thiomargarita nelsonii]
MNKKRLIVLITLLIIIVVLGTLPYFIGGQVEQRFPNLNQALSNKFKLKQVDSTYERGWFHSSAQTLVEWGKSGSNDNRLIMVHEIDHGFLPIRLPMVDTTIRPPLSTATLLEAHTTVQINGGIVIQLKIPAQQVKDEKAHLQWQDFEGTVYANRSLTAIQTEIRSPQIQLETAQGQIVIQQMSLQADVQPGSTNFLQEGRLSIADIRLAGKQKPLVRLKGLELVGNNDIVSDNLMIGMKTGLQQIEVGADQYGPGFGRFELLHWHVPTLMSIKNTMTEIQSRGLPKRLQDRMLKLRLAPYGVALLKNTPEFAITNLNFNMPEGELRGALRVKMEPFDQFALAAFNPSLLLNILDAQLDMHIPQSLLQDDSTADETIRQRLNVWLEQGILIVAKDQPNYYQSQMQLKGGILQVNGLPLPIATILSEN